MRFYPKSYEDHNAKGEGIHLAFNSRITCEVLYTSVATEVVTVNYFLTNIYFRCCVFHRTPTVSGTSYLANMC